MMRILIVVVVMVKFMDSSDIPLDRKEIHCDEIVGACAQRMGFYGMELCLPMSIFEQQSMILSSVLPSKVGTIQ